MIDCIDFGAVVEKESDFVFGVFVEMKNFDKDVPGPVIEDVVHRVDFTKPESQYFISSIVFWFKDFQCPKEHVFEETVNFG